jgi:hypothetical protein
MRPHSEVRLDVAAALIDGGGTTHALAQRTGWSVGLVRWALDNMVRSQPPQAAKRFVRVAGVRRPVPFYQRPPEAVDVDADDAPAYRSLIEAWAAPVPRLAGRVGVAM